MKFDKEQLNLLEKLSNEYRELNPYAKYLDGVEVERILAKGNIYLSEKYKGYMTTENFDNFTRIIDIYSSSNKKEAFSSLIKKIKGNIKYVGVFEKNPLSEALEERRLKIVREHHQMIKLLNDDTKKQNITLLDLSDLESEEILNFIKENAPDANYTLDEIKKKKYSRYSFYIFDESLIGLIIAFQNGKELYLEQLVIKKNYQGLGYGTKLLKQMIFLAKEYGLIRVRLHVYKDNFVAYNLYEKYGFKLDKIIAYWESSQWQEKSLN